LYVDICVVVYFIYIHVYPSLSIKLSSVIKQRLIFIMNNILKYKQNK